MTGLGAKPEQIQRVMETAERNSKKAPAACRRVSMVMMRGQECRGGGGGGMPGGAPGGGMPGGGAARRHDGGGLQAAALVVARRRRTGRTQVDQVVVHRLSRRAACRHVQSDDGSRARAGAGKKLQKMLKGKRSMQDLSRAKSGRSSFAKMRELTGGGPGGRAAVQGGAPGGGRGGA